MKTMHFIILLFISMGQLSCTNKGISKNDIDKFISKYQGENFDAIKGMSVFERSRSGDEIVYGVSMLGEGKPPYFVEYSISRKSVIKINKSLLTKASVTEYLTADEIARAINTITEYGFFLLSVDSSRNVFINPFSSNSPAYFLRLNVLTGDSVVRKGYVYEQYRNNWYINRTK